MSYVEQNLIPGERVLYSTGLHWVVLVGSFAGGIVLELAAVASLTVFARMTRRAAR